MGLFENKEKLSGVCCDAANCKYHRESNCCCADSIQVETPGAAKKADTFCSTFCAKDE